MQGAPVTGKLAFQQEIWGAQWGQNKNKNLSAPLFSDLIQRLFGVGRVSLRRKGHGAGRHFWRWRQVLGTPRGARPQPSCPLTPGPLCGRLLRDQGLVRGNTAT